jgi:hypothetical protein
MKEALSEKQSLKDINSSCKSNPGKALLLYQICLLVFADNRVDPKELEEIDSVFALIDWTLNLKKSNEFCESRSGTVETFRKICRKGEPCYGNSLSDSDS